jgi:hypothetical protein
VIYDAKDRMLKITHSILFIITAWERIQFADILQIILVLFYCSVIDHLRHFSSLAMAGRYSEVETIYLEAVRSFESRNDKVERCMEWDFTVIPYVLLLMKFFDLTMWAHGLYDTSYNKILIIILTVLAIYTWILTPIMHKFIYKKIHSEEMKNI